MGSVFFLNCFTILNNLCFSWQEICPPQQSHCCPLPTQSQLYGFGSSSRAQILGIPRGEVGRGSTCWAEPGPPETQRCFVSPGTNENGPKSFRAAPVYSRVKPELQACLKMPHSSDILSVCPHIACMVPTHQILLFMQLPEFPRPFNLAWMHNDCSVFNDTETFEHCISRIPSCEH